MQGQRLEKAGGEPGDIEAFGEDGTFDGDGGDGDIDQEMLMSQVRLCLHSVHWHVTIIVRRLLTRARTSLGPAPAGQSAHTVTNTRLRCSTAHPVPLVLL